MKCISSDQGPLPVQDIYRWFNAVTNEEMAVLEVALTAGMPVDVLHPLRHTTALMEATRLGRAHASQWLLAHGAAPGLLCGSRSTSPLHTAIRQGNAALTEAMLHSCEHASIVDHGGRTPIHMLAQYGGRAEEAVWLHIAHMLIEKCPRLDALDSEGITALHYALIHEWPELAELLLEHRANPNALALDTGVSPLMMAALNQQRPMVRLLLKYGANPYLPAGDGKTAMALMPDIKSMLTSGQALPQDSITPELAHARHKRHSRPSRKRLH